MKTIIEHDTPWGPSEFHSIVAAGIVFHATRGHGGYHLDDRRTREFYQRFADFETFCRQSSWFEEDCDAAVVVVAFPEEFGVESVDRAREFLEGLATRHYRYAYVLAVLAAEGMRCSDCGSPLNEFGVCQSCI